jgi:CHAT domain-containing protein/tetratricopeptide (TPR) repeat protein
MVDYREKSIAHLRSALEAAARHADPAMTATLHARLGTAYANRRSGSPADNVESAIKHYGQALLLEPREASPFGWAETHHNLGTAYVSRIRGDKAGNLEGAIDHFRSALAVRTRASAPEGWASTHANLGVALQERVRGERARNLERAIRHHRKALQVYAREDFPARRASTLCNLANAYVFRVRGERAENLERAIGLYGQALELIARAAAPDDWALAQTNLALALMERVRGQRSVNVEQAIQCCERALEVYRRDERPVEWARIQNTLGLLGQRYRGAGRAGYLARSVRHFEAALEVATRESLPELWAGLHLNLANTVLLVSEAGGEAAAAKAIDHSRKAQEVFTAESHPERWAMAEANVATACSVLAQAGEPGLVDRALQDYGVALGVFDRERYPEQHRRLKSAVGDLYFERERWAEAHAAYREAIDAGEYLLREAYTDAGRGAEAGENARLFARDAYCLLRTGRAEDALVQLDRGKTRVLSEVLALADADRADPSRAELLAVHQKLRALDLQAHARLDTARGDGNGDIGEALRAARADLRRIVSAIRGVDRGFMPEGIELGELMELAPRDGALVAPVVTSRGGAAFVLSRDARGVASSVVPLDRFTDTSLQVLLNGAPETTGWGGWLGTYAKRSSDHSGWLGMIDAACLVLWNELMEPIHQHLAGLGLKRGSPVVLLPQGGLSLLPLHAAYRVENREPHAFIDDFTVSYAPSAHVLSICRKRSREVPRQQKALLAVVDPTGDLDWAALEGEAVGGLFPERRARMLKGSDAKARDVIEAGGDPPYLHFACHAFYSWDDATQSALVLAGRERLTMAEVIGRLNLANSRLVTLSACETGITEPRVSPDEYLGLPSGFLQAGAAAVVSSLWEVNDLSTMLLMERFYKCALGTGRALPLARALRAAQRWLKRASADSLRRRLAAMREALGADHPSAATLSGHFRRFAEMESDSRPFTHPYHWAGFTLSGA